LSYAAVFLESALFCSLFTCCSQLPASAVRCFDAWSWVHLSYGRLCLLSTVPLACLSSRVCLPLYLRLLLFSRVSQSRCGLVAHLSLAAGDNPNADRNTLPHHEVQTYCFTPRLVLPLHASLLPLYASLLPLYSRRLKQVVGIETYADVRWADGTEEYALLNTCLNCFTLCVFGNTFSTVAPLISC
jgi:hypothetical protein